MKKKLFMPALLGAALLVACQPVEPEKTEEFGSLSINLSSPAAPTKADVTPLNCENMINKMRVVVFDNAGNVFKDTQLESPYNSLTINQMKVGQYTVCAVANTCASLSSTAGAIASATVLENTAVSLSDCSTDQNTGFVMYDKKAGVNVTAGTTASQVSLSVTRYPARIRLVSVTNGLPAFKGDLTVKYVMLINGYSTWNIGASGNPTNAVNAAGRNASGNIISSAESADSPNQTFWAVDQELQTITHNSATKSYKKSFYSFPNQVESDVTTAGGKGGKMRLVVVASVGGTTYYYPVTLTNVERNKCYDVQLTISGLGSEDPNIPVEKGAAAISISVKDWAAGTDYTETI